MGFLSLLEVSSMPILQVLIISLLGAIMATDYLKLLPPDARDSLNKIVFVVFAPSLVFSSLAKSVRFEDMIAWWFMPVNIGITFAIGGTLGWIAAKLLRLQPHLQNLVISMCAAGNLGNIMLLLIPAICNEDGNPFGDRKDCTTRGLPYASFSMALGAFYIWTCCYHLILSASQKYKAMNGSEETPKAPNKDLEADYKMTTLLVHDEDRIPVSSSPIEEKLVGQGKESKSSSAPWKTQIIEILQQIVEVVKTPPVMAAIIGFIFGSVSWLRHLILGSTAPLRVIDDCIKLLGDGTIPCIILILGGNLREGLSKGSLRPTAIIAVICVRYIILPCIGIGIIKAASQFGFVPLDPLYRFVLMVQFTLPPAMNIGTMTQLFDVAQEECSVLYIWTYLLAAVALTGWSTVFMWILS